MDNLWGRKRFRGKVRNTWKNPDCNGGLFSRLRMLSVVPRSKSYLLVRLLRSVFYLLVRLLRSVFWLMTVPTMTGHTASVCSPAKDSTSARSAGNIASPGVDYEGVIT